MSLTAPNTGGPIAGTISAPRTIASATTSAASAPVTETGTSADKRPVETAKSWSPSPVV